MKTKFTIYCVLLALVYACNYYISVNTNDIENQEDYNDGYKVEVGEALWTGESFLVSIPYTMTGTCQSETNDSVYNKKSGTMLPLHSDSFIVKIQSKASTFYFIFAILIGIIYVYTIITFIKFFISVYKGNVFDSMTENRARILGIAQIIMYVLAYINYALTVNEANNSVEIEGYSIDYSTFTLSPLYIGFILLILSEVFRMARKLKEEQEFTI